MKKTYAAIKPDKINGFLDTHGHGFINKTKNVLNKSGNSQGVLHKAVYHIYKGLSVFEYETKLVMSDIIKAPK